jgi:hypothetical protein
MSVATMMTEQPPFVPEKGLPEIVPATGQIAVADRSGAPDGVFAQTSRDTRG